LEIAEFDPAPVRLWTAAIARRTDGAAGKTAGAKTPAGERLNGDVSLPPGSFLSI
jgi:hypothetical protein